MIHVFKQNQFLPIGLTSAWDFFSRPEKLNEITPKDMQFRVISSLPEQVYPGLMIVYKIEIFKGIPFDWVTEITHVQAPYFFVDEQRVGPYSMWHHEHHFKEVKDGVQMTDIVHYQLPFGVLGESLHNILVKPRLESIFGYRKNELETLFNK